MTFTSVRYIEVSTGVRYTGIRCIQARCMGVCYIGIRYIEVLTGIRNIGVR